MRNEKNRKKTKQKRFKLQRNFPFRWWSLYNVLKWRRNSKNVIPSSSRIVVLFSVHNSRHYHKQQQSAAGVFRNLSSVCDYDLFSVMDPPPSSVLLRLIQFQLTVYKPHPPNSSLDFPNHYVRVSSCFTLYTLSLFDS